MALKRVEYDWCDGGKWPRVARGCCTEHLWSVGSVWCNEALRAKIKDHPEAISAAPYTGSHVTRGCVCATVRSPVETPSMVSQGHRCALLSRPPLGKDSSCRFYGFCPPLDRRLSRQQARMSPDETLEGTPHTEWQDREGTCTHGDWERHPRSQDSQT